MILEFRVVGVAQQMGSKWAFNRRGLSHPVITDSNKNLKTWQLLVAESANQAIQQLPPSERTLIITAVHLTVVFYLPRPQVVPKHGQHVKAPDLDKLIRALGDALTHVAYHDDRLITTIIAAKRYAAEGEVPHIDVRVAPADDAVPSWQDQPLFAMSR